MSQRFTVKDVRAIFGTFREVCLKAGIEQAREYVLQEGSATNGRSYRLYVEETASGGLADPIFGNYLGWTAKEAYDKLSAYTRAISVTRR